MLVDNIHIMKKHTNLGDEIFTMKKPDIEEALTTERQRGAEEGMRERYCFREGRDKCSCEDKDVWKNFWQEILENEDGSINVEQLKKELQDITHVLDQIPEIYCRLTGNLLSKTGYWAEQIVGEHDAQVEKSYEQGNDDGQIEALENVLARIKKMQNDGRKTQSVTSIIEEELQSLTPDNHPNK